MPCYAIDCLGEDSLHKGGEGLRGLTIDVATRALQEHGQPGFSQDVAGVIAGCPINTNAAVHSCVQHFPDGRNPGRQPHVG